MRNKLTALFLPLFIVAGLDQWSKYIIRTSPELHRLEVIPDVFDFLYLQNSGMALGLDFFSTKTISLISIIATIGIVAYTLFTLAEVSMGYLLCIGMILGGAVGNIIDRFTMGFIEGYGGLLEGHVVDFLHFSLQIGDFAVFPYVFNVADSFITVSVAILLIFHKKLMPAPEPTEQNEEFS